MQLIDAIKRSQVGIMTERKANVAFNAKEMLRNGFAKVSKIHFNLEHPLAASLFSMSIDFLVIFF